VSVRGRMRSPRPAASSIAFIGLSYRITASAAHPGIERFFNFIMKNMMATESTEEHGKISNGYHCCPVTLVSGLYTGTPKGRSVAGVISFRVLPWIPWP
jgi:hypothetical protein